MTAKKPKTKKPAKKKVAPFLVKLAPPEATVLREALLRVGWKSLGTRLTETGTRWTAQDLGGSYVLMDFDNAGRLLGASAFGVY